MLGFPKTTELYKPLPKKAIYTKFCIDTAKKEKIDADISKITIVNEISSTSLHVVEGGLVKNFFVLLVNLKKKDFDHRTIAYVSNLIPQNILFILEYGDEAKLAVYHTKLMQTSWQAKDSFSIQLSGLTLDNVWKNIIMQVGDIQIENASTLDEQIEINDRRQKLEKGIDRLDKLLIKEKQPKKKFEMFQQIKQLKKELEEI